MRSHFWAYRGRGFAALSKVFLPRLEATGAHGFEIESVLPASPPMALAGEQRRGGARPRRARWPIAGAGGASCGPAAAGRPATGGIGEGPLLEQPARSAFY